MHCLTMTFYKIIYHHIRVTNFNIKSCAYLIDAFLCVSCHMIAGSNTRDTLPACLLHHKTDPDR